MSKIIDRVGEIIAENNLSIRSFELSIGASNGTIGRAIKNKTDISAEWLSKIIKIHSNISSSWLLTGEGEMFINKEQPSIATQNDLQEAYPTTAVAAPRILQCSHAASCNCTGDCERCTIPIVPTELSRATDVDIFEEVHRGNVQRQPVVKQFPRADIFYRLMTKAMEPYICSGDKLALAAYPKGNAAFEPGLPHVIDTASKGFVTRLLFHHPEGYLVRTYYPDRYPDFVIPYDDVMRIYRIVGLLRANVQ